MKDNWDTEGYIRQTSGGRGHYLELDYKRAEQFIANHDKRVILRIGEHSYHRALQMRKDGYALITLSKSLLKENGIRVGDRIACRISKDESQYGMDFPGEFREVLAQDDEARTIFEALRPGLQRGVLHYVASAKSTDSRIKRALEIAEKMKTGRLHGQS